APASSAGGLSSSYSDAPWADRLNPAASATQQRPVIDLGYGLLSDFASQGIGSAINLGVSLPQNYGVWGGGLSFVSTPGTMSDLPLGTFANLRGGISKELYPGFSVGADLSSTVGSNGGFGWGLGLDLGVMGRAASLGALSDFRWGMSLSGIGKAYSTPLPAGSTGYPPAFTLSGGAGAVLFKAGDFSLGGGVDLTTPAFSDFGFGFHANAAYKDLLTLRVGWGLPSVLSGSSKSILPSFGLIGNFPLSFKKDASFISQKGWDQSDIKPALSALPLYGNIWQLGLGATIDLGVVDRTPPAISAQFPTTKWGPAYISPNADGKFDNIEIPIKIVDNRYVASYDLTISPTGSATPLRTIANKEVRPVSFSFATLWQRLTFVENGIPVPDKLVWNGFGDTGEKVPDGSYDVRLSAADGNGNVATAGPWQVVVDTTPPSATIKAPDSLIFSPDGDGNKDTITIGLSGSQEDLWSLGILDATGTTIRHARFTEAAPTDFTWDGKNDAGTIVPDGVYSFVISSVDRAGNPWSGRLDNIIVNTQQPPINLAIDSAAFSPNGDGSRDTIAFLPNVPVRTGLVSWKLSVLDKSRAEIWSMSGSTAEGIPLRYSWDGKAGNGKTIAEGSYQAKLSVNYQNGYSPISLSPTFLCDLTPPKAKVSSDGPAFNPEAVGGHDHVAFTQSADKDARWTGEISGSDGKVVRTWVWNGRPDAKFAWDGSNDEGALVPDGNYSYRLKALDRAGNSMVTDPIAVSLDTVKKAARLSADLRAFSPNGDGVKDAVKLSDSIVSNDKVKSWTLVLQAATDGASTPVGAVLRTWSGSKALPESFSWDGLKEDGAKAADGRYVAVLSVDWINGDHASTQTLPITLDTLAPSITVSASPLVFAPNGSSSRPSTTISQKSVPGDDWTGVISDASGASVRTWNWKDEARDVVWDGTDESGNRVPDGLYSYKVSSADAAGNKGEGSVQGIKVDARIPQVFVTSSAPGLSPNGDGVMDSITFSFIVNILDGISSWKFSLFDASGEEQASFGGTGADLPPRLVWDGKTKSGNVIDGKYSGLFEVSYEKGDVAKAKTGTIIVASAPPVVDFGIAPPYFSPDNDGVNDELTMSLGVKSLVPIATWSLDVFEQSIEEGGGASKTRTFTEWSGTGMPASTITWDGKSSTGDLVQSATDYPVTFRVTDVFGNSTVVNATVTVDILVIKEGDKLKIKVPSIVFRANAADFNGLDQATLDNNAKVIKRIADSLNKFKDYRISIEGFANSIGKIYGYSAAKIADEETNELIPLSKSRADLVRQLLVKDGVDPRRLSVEGMGSADPVVPFADAANRWKNRRVEFILIKNTPAGATASGG
ncbi:MAG TPA: FlgD immunoglobulin-like domain containing protein, partial [Rectinemataceae bacterium]|nr:FlgD immunoglobulin-like domain containing protein [Rectinemataceae bacterium]